MEGAAPPQAPLVIQIVHEEGTGPTGGAETEAEARTDNVMFPGLPDDEPPGFQRPGSCRAQMRRQSLEIRGVEPDLLISSAALAADPTTEHGSQGIEGYPENQDP